MGAAAHARTIEPAGTYRCDDPPPSLPVHAWVAAFRSWGASWAGRASWSALEPSRTRNLDRHHSVTSVRHTQAATACTACSIDFTSDPKWQLTCPPTRHACGTYRCPMIRRFVSLLCAIGLPSSSAKLFALNDVPSGMPGSFRLVTIDLGDGTRVPVSQTGAEINYTPGSSTIDRDHSVLYFIGQPQPNLNGPWNLTVVGVSLETGAVISTANIPGADSIRSSGEIWTAGIAYASDLGKLVLSISTAANSHLVGTVHPSTGDWNLLATVDHPSSVGTVQPGSETYIPGKQTYLFQLGVNHVITQFAYDFKTGVLRNATSPQFSDFVYNPHDGMVWGHGVAIGPNKTYFVRTLAKMDSATLKFEPVHSGLEVLTVENAGPAFDEDRQIMYWMTDLFKDMAKTQGAGPFPVHLAQLSLINPAVVNVSVVLCASYECPECNYNTSCPGTLNFL